jgi:hypothetical protein
MPGFQLRNLFLELEPVSGQTVKLEKVIRPDPLAGHPDPELCVVELTPAQTPDPFQDSPGLPGLVLL